MQSNPVHLIAGLGNPGRRFCHTRHNVGFDVIERWSRDLGVRLGGRRFKSRHVKTRFQNTEIILLCPLTYMNRSGHAVSAWFNYYALQAANVLVIHDDVDLPPGRLKFTRGGGAGGHKGVGSIIEQLGSGKFPRLKIGVGRPPQGEAVEKYVLSRFYPDEEELIEKVIQLAVQGCQLFVLKGIESAMNQINSQNLANKEEDN
jgi:PTH1 family peptidyl-tRNA hydrolase